MAFAAIGLVVDGYWAVGVIAADGIAFGLWVPYADSANGYYTSENVPVPLKSLGASLHSFSSIFHKHLGIILTLFVSRVMALNLMIGREGKRVYRKDGWLIDG